uniref:Uncharacterized protein n=4 Tax=Oryza TaxID=4527 RepID=A0A0D3GG37_9ORYZ
MAASPMVIRSRVLARAVSASLRRTLAAPPSPLLAASSRRASSLHRLPSVCGGLLSVMPLHSAVASARLRSAISPESQSWGIVPQVGNQALYTSQW